MTQPEMVRASLLADDGRETHHGVYRHRASMAHGPVHEAPKREPINVAPVRKMRQSRKRRKGNLR